MVKIKKNVSLRKNTTFNIGGKAKYFAEIFNAEELKKVLFWAEEKKLPVFILGGGSNILFPDNGYKGIVVKISNKEAVFEKNKVIVGAGLLLLKLVLLTKEKSLSGLEWAAGIPGTVGGAIFGNAGAFGGEMKDSIKEVLALDKKTKKEKVFKNKECSFSYRNSIFKIKKRHIIISATFEFKKGNRKKMLTEIKKNISYRKENHPLEYPSAGSIFKNQKINKKTEKLFEKYPEFKKFKKRGEIPAAFLVEKCKLPGKKIGGAQISKKHTNFIINKKSAKAKDVILLINFTKKKIKKEFNINLKEEIIFL